MDVNHHHHHHAGGGGMRMVKRGRKLWCGKCQTVCYMKTMLCVECSQHEVGM